LTGIALVLATATHLGHATETGRAAGPALSVLALMLGLFLLALAVRGLATTRGARTRAPPTGVDQRRRFPRPGPSSRCRPPVGRRQPKEPALLLPAGIALARARLPGEEQVLVAAAFMLVATSTVLVPVLLHGAMGPRVNPLLVAMRGFLTRHGTAISVVLLLVVGTVLAAQGVSGLATTLQVA
jgi:hypothetical protein